MNGLADLGIAVLNWLTRNAGPSSVRNAIVLANIVGFGAVAANDIWSVASGDARDIAKFFMAAHIAFALGFIGFGRAWRRA